MIKVYTGPMFSGKSGAMIIEYNKIYDKSKIICFKSKIDTRDGNFIKSKQFPDVKIPAIGIEKYEDIKEHLDDKHKIIFLDEANFISGDPKELLYLSVDKNLIIHVSGLSLTAEQDSFRGVPYVMALADHIYFYKSECHYCGREARWTHYTAEKNEEIIVGDANYVALCSDCLRQERLKT